MSSVPQRPAVSEIRTCPTCGQSKPLSEFPAQNKARGLYRAECKLCYKARCGEVRRAQQSAYRERNRDRIRPKASAYSAKYRQRNPQKVGVALQQWRKNNAARVLEYAASRYAANPDKFIADKHSARAKALGVEGVWSGEDWAALKTRYGNRCLCCGQSDCTITVDHVVPLSKGGTNHLHNIQPLCLSCNQSKGQDAKDYRGSNGAQ